MSPEESSEYVRWWRIGLSSLCFLAFSPSIAHRVNNACWSKDRWPDWPPLLTLSPQRRGYECYECPKPSATGPGTPTPIRMALVNARSLVNKSFYFKQFFTSHALDYLCVTETWISGSDISTFSEALPINCTYFNSLRSSGLGGWVATIFKEKCICRQLSSTNYSSFDLNIFELGRFESVFCTVIYRPPKYNKDFINDFSDYLCTRSMLETLLVQFGPKYHNCSH